MNLMAPIEQSASLPAMLQQASNRLANATTAAEILEAKVSAEIVYDEAKRARRLADAKGAHDTVTAAALRAQADANEIIAQAQRRLADEYDAAQERGEVSSGRPKSLPDGNTSSTVADIGLTSKEVHQARQFRDAEVADPGITRRALDGMLERGAEPTKAALRREIIEASKMGLQGRTGSPAPSNKNPMYRAPTEAGKAWTHLYGVCRAFAEWATDENMNRAAQGMRERDDSQVANIHAVQKAAALLNEFAENLDAH